ncbi:MAG: ABC transporter substrate-binding protein [Alphaproteobacteria bacterium]|jgi:microcin C transport system substrate-binding protein|nr:ABC transporter substrate-binding protein [Alphaproteobacteria bacterium]MBT7942331.1 ABC transporter substrate-binding protein [Alphaproteobacteria bacterium]
MRLFAAFAITALTVVFALAPADAVAAEKSHGVAMHGDLKYPAGFKNLEYVNPNAPKGGLVRLSATGTFDSFNSFIVKGNPAAGLGFLYDNLMYGSADEAFSQYGQLAESVEVPKDRSWVAFTLRPQARWHDGKPVTVEDVIFSFDLLIKKGSPFYRFYYGSVSEVIKTGPRTVRFNFKPGENRELPLILGQLTVLPKHYWETRDFSKTTLEPPFGSGPYKIDSFEPGRSITYKRVKNWWGRDIPVHRGQYNFDTIRYDYYRDATVALLALKAGEYDYRAENSSKAWATAYDTANVKNGLIQKVEINHNRSSGMQAFVFNTRRDIFKDHRVREALSYAFDFEWSNKNLFYGQYARTRSYFDNSELAATGVPKGDELKLLEPYRGRIPDEVFSQEYNPPKNDGSGNVRRNLRTGGKLLSEAGWRIKGNKRVNTKTGKALEFEVLLVSPLFERIVLPFAKNLEKLGVSVRVRTVDPSQYRRRIDTFDFDVIVGGAGQSLSPGNEQRSYWGSKAADIEGGRNTIGIKDPVIDELIEKVIAAPDRKALVTAVRALDRVLLWGHWLIPHWHAKYDRVAYWDKFGRPKITPLQGNQFLTWWVDATKEDALKSKLASAGK